MKVKFIVGNNPESLDADLQRVRTIVTALTGLVDPKTGEPPKLWLGKSIEIIGSSKVQAEAFARLKPVLEANPDYGKMA